MGGTWFSIAADFLSTMICLYAYFFLILTPKRGSRLSVYLISVGCFMAYAIAFKYIWIPPVFVFFMMGQYALTAAMFKVLSKDSWKRVLLSLASWILMGLVTDLIILFLMNVFINKIALQYIYTDIETEYLNMGRLAGALVMDVVMMVIALCYLCLIERKERKLFAGFLLIPLYQFSMAVGFLMLCKDFSNRVAYIGLAMGVFNLVLDGIVLYFLKGIFHRQDMEAEMRALEEKRQQEYAYYEADSRYVEEMRLLRHDFANQLQAAYGMMDEPENAEKVKKLLEEMKGKVEEKARERAKVSEKGE